MTLDDVYEELLGMVSEVGAQVSVPLESEEFFSGMVTEFTGSREQFLDFVRENLRRWFRTVHTSPQWIQEAEWQFSDGKPMVFVGQIDVPREKGLFHDDASFYVFWNPVTGETKNVIQVA